MIDLGSKSDPPLRIIIPPMWCMHKKWLCICNCSRSSGERAQPGLHHCSGEEGARRVPEYSRKARSCGFVRDELLIKKAFAPTFLPISVSLAILVSILTPVSLDVCIPIAVSRSTTTHCNKDSEEGIWSKMKRRRKNNNGDATISTCLSGINCRAGPVPASITWDMDGKSSVVVLDTQGGCMHAGGFVLHYIAAGYKKLWLCHSEAAGAEPTWVKCFICLPPPPLPRICVLLASPRTTWIC